MTAHEQLDAWIDAHFDDEVRFLQELVRVPTDTPPGDNAPHAERTAELLAAMGLPAEKHPLPAWALREYGLQSITNLIVRRRFAADGPVQFDRGGSELLKERGDAALLEGQFVPFGRTL